VRRWRSVDPVDAVLVNRRYYAVPTYWTGGSKMLKRNLGITLGVCGALALVVASLSAQTNPRYGKWKIKSDAPPPTSNIMTYEPYQGKGMKITINAVNKDGVKSEWGYTTMFDGKDEPLVGNPGTDTGSVKILNDKVNEIVYKKGGRVTQVLTNVLSADGKTIGVLYMRYDAEGHCTGVTSATYEKIE
jgi:hypothetical protein